MQNFRALAQKLRLPRPFQFWTSEGRGSLTFWAKPSKFWSSIYFLYMFNVVNILESKACIMVWIWQYLKRLRNGSWSNLKVQKICPLWSKIDVFFCSSKFDQLPFLSPLRYKGVTYLFRKPKAIPIESKLEIGWILTLMYPYLYVTKRGVLLGLEGLHRVQSTLGLKFTQFWVCIQLELL